jgi:phosphatidylserine/phosphatidylglycerophosphate/cardiolipin synthase-like enzyme
MRFPKWSFPSMSTSRLSILPFVLVIVSSVAAYSSTANSPAREWHFSPAENLETIDLQLVNGATKSIDILAHTLVDRPLIEALNRASFRGVAVRIVLENNRFHQLEKFSSTLSTRVNLDSSHTILNGYVIDGVVVRTGSAEFSPSGLIYRNTWLDLARAPAAVSDFGKLFDSEFAKAVPIHRAQNQMVNGWSWASTSRH